MPNLKTQDRRLMTAHHRRSISPPIYPVSASILPRTPKPSFPLDSANKPVEQRQDWRWTILSPSPTPLLTPAHSPPTKRPTLPGDPPSWPRSSHHRNHHHSMNALAASNCSALPSPRPFPPPQSMPGTSSLTPLPEHPLAEPTERHVGYQGRQGHERTSKTRRRRGGGKKKKHPTCYECQGRHLFSDLIPLSSPSSTRRELNKVNN